MYNAMGRPLILAEDSQYMMIESERPLTLIVAFVHTAAGMMTEEMRLELIGAGFKTMRDRVKEGSVMASFAQEDRKHKRAMSVGNAGARASQMTVAVVATATVAESTRSGAYNEMHGAKWLAQPITPGRSSREYGEVGIDPTGEEKQQHLTNNHAPLVTTTTITSRSPGSRL